MCGENQKKAWVKKSVFSLGTMKILCSFILKNITVCVCRKTSRQVPWEALGRACILDGVRPAVADWAMPHVPHTDRLKGKPPKKRSVHNKAAVGRVAVF